MDVNACQDQSSQTRSRASSSSAALSIYDESRVVVSEQTRSEAMPFGERCNNEPMAVSGAIIGDALNIGQTRKLSRERGTKWAVNTNGFKMIGHARCAIDNADFIGPTIARQLRRVVNHVADFGEAGRLKTIHASDWLKRGLQG